MKKCEKCGKEIDGLYGSGRFCNVKCANSRIFSEESKNKKRLANLGKKSTNKGQIAHNKGKLGSESTAWKGGRKKFICIHCGKEGFSYKPNKYHKKCWLNCSGGYKKGSSRGKCGWYKGYWCDSSYELAWVIYNLDHNIRFERNVQKFKYTFENKIKNYIPDFILNNTYIEIKGFNTVEVDEKIKQFPHKIKVLYRMDLNIEFDYVLNKYGKNFIELYK